MKMTLDHKKSEFLARNKNLSALNTYTDETLASTAKNSHNKGLTSIKTQEDLEKVLFDKLIQSKKKSPKHKTGFKYTFTGNYDK